MDKVLRCAIYIRVSSAEQVMHGKSLDAQLRFLTDYAEQKGWKLVGHFADEGKTARKELKRRKAIKELLECVKRDEIDIILFWKMDRWFRNVADFYKVQDILDAHGCKWVAAAEPGMNLDTREGRLNVNIMLSINQNETDTTSERIKFVNESSIRQGKAIFGNASLPMGYKVDVVDGIKCIAKDPEKEPLVNEVFEYYLKHQTKNGTVKYINRKYGDVFSIQAMMTMTKHTFYYGSYRGNDNYCPAYITKKEYEFMQDINKKNIKEKANQQMHDPYLFVGLFICPICGRRLAAARRQRKNGEFYRYYRCVNHYTNRLCDYSKTINESTAEAYIVENILRICEEKCLDIMKISESKKRSHEDNSAKYSKELERLNNMYQKGRISEERYDSEYSRLSALISDHGKTIEYISITHKSLEHIRRSLTGEWVDMYLNLSRENKRSFWRGIIDNIVCDTERGAIRDINFLHK